MLSPIAPVRFHTDAEHAVAMLAPTGASGRKAPAFQISAPSPPRIEAGRTPPAGPLILLPIAAKPADRLSDDVLVAPHALGSDATLRDLLRDRSQDALARTADARDESPVRFARAAAVIPGELSPSRNHADAHATLRDTLLMKDPDGDLLTVDLFLSRIAESAWEAAAFDAAGSARSGAFPYADGPIGVAALRFDPQRGQFRSDDRGRMLQVVGASAPSRTRARPGSGRVVLAGMILSVAALFAGRWLA